MPSDRHGVSPPKGLALAKNMVCVRSACGIECVRVKDLDVGSRHGDND